jgi:hypothetical protein
VQQRITGTFKRLVLARPSLATVKDVFATLQSLATIVGLVGAGWWFYKQRETEPKAKVEQVVSQRVDAQASSRTLVGIEVRVTNTGYLRLDLKRGTILVEGVNPGLPRKPGGPPESRKLFEHHVIPTVLESGEFDQCFFTRISLPNQIKTIQITTSFPVPNEQGEFWIQRGLFDIGTNAPEKGSAVFTGEQPRSLF